MLSKSLIPSLTPQLPRTRLRTAALNSCVAAALLAAVLSGAGCTRPGEPAGNETESQRAAVAPAAQAATPAAPATTPAATATPLAPSAAAPAAPTATRKPGAAFTAVDAATSPSLAQIEQILASEGRLVAESVPRLVVVVSIDQFAAAYLTKYQPLYGPDGFMRMMREGYWARDCRYDHSGTMTAIGHSVMLTGANPNRTGIVGNAWLRRDVGKVLESVDDLAERVVTSKGPEGKENGASPRMLLSPTVGDDLRLETNGRSRQVSISVKDRGSIMMSGHRPDLCLWWDREYLQFVTSTYYAKSLPAWLVLFNDRHNIRKYYGAKWELSRPEWQYGLQTADDVPWEGGNRERRMFPKTLVPPFGAGTEGERRMKDARDGMGRVISSPYGNEMILELTEAAIVAERLGADEIPDLLTVSFSLNDYVGHEFGPNSWEVADMTLRTDDQMARLLRILDQRIGPGEYTIFVTADHGIVPAPEYAKSMGFEVGRVNPTELRILLERELQKQFPQNDDKPDTATFIQEVMSPWIYLDPGAIAARGADGAKVREAVRDLLVQQKGIAAAYTAEELREGRFAASDRLAASMAKNYYAGRAGDVAVAPLPNWLLSGGKSGTTHGAPYVYDQHVPMLAYGKGIARGREVLERVSVTDLAPTVAHLLGISPPANAEGRALPGALLAFNRSTNSTGAPTTPGAPGR